MNSFGCKEWLFAGVGPLSELGRLYKHGLVHNGMPYWVINDEVGKDVFDHTLSTVTVKVPNVKDFSFRCVSAYPHRKMLPSPDGNAI